MKSTLGDPMKQHDSSTHNGDIKVEEKVVTLCGWPTDTVSVTYQQLEGNNASPHTLLVFFPGNPGCVDWYTPNLVDLIQRLGPGFAAHGVSYAGHSPKEDLTAVEDFADDDKNNASVAIPWTVDGQIQHKIEFMDTILSQWPQRQSSRPRLIFMSHSIGGHMVERLCILRKDILQRTIGILHLMPFIRMHPDSSLDRFKLDLAATYPEHVQSVAKWAMQVLRGLPASWVDFLARPTFEDAKGRELAVQLLRQPNFAKNFFELGSEELRDVPQNFDKKALEVLSRYCTIHILYAGQDQWGPDFHAEELRAWVQSSPKHAGRVHVTQRTELLHAYVSRDDQVPVVVDWCHEAIQQILVAQQTPRSRL